MNMNSYLKKYFASYKSLAAMGWKQDRIAKVKGVSQQMVSFRLNCATLPDSIKHYFINKDFLNERQACELLKLLTANNLSSWLDKETAMQEIMASVLKLKQSAYLLYSEGNCREGAVC